MIYAYNNCRNRHRSTKEALLHPRMAPFQRLMNFGSNYSFLEILGFNKDNFRKLSRLIYTADELANKRVVGRPHTLSSCERLGLTIMFLSSNMKMKHLCMIFGAVPTVV